MWKIKTFWKYLKNRYKSSWYESRHLGWFTRIKELLLVPLHAYILMKQEYEFEISHPYKTKSQMGNSLITVR